MKQAPTVAVIDFFTLTSANYWSAAGAVNYQKQNFRHFLHWDRHGRKNSDTILYRKVVQKH
jgi:hypothetical protein